MGKKLPASIFVSVVLLTSVLYAPPVEAANLSSIPASIGSYITNALDFFAGLFNAPTPAPTPLPPAPAPAAVTQEATPPSTTTTITKTIYLPAASSPYVTVSPANGVSEAELTQKLATLQSTLQAQINNKPAVYSDTAPTRINNLTFNNLTVNGVTGLTVADIPDLSSKYLPLASGSNDIDVFLVAGQSNAQGYNNTSSGPTATAGTAYQYYNGKISVANDPVGNASTGSAWPQFAISYYEKTGRKVAFVPTAVPSSALVAAADLGTGYWSSGGTLFNTSVSQVNAAMTAFQQAGYAPHFAGVLWDQGESDALAINNALITSGIYQTALQTLISSYRAQFGSNMPFYIFKTGTFVGYNDTGFAAVRNAQEAVTAADSNTLIVFRNAVDFPGRGLMNPDGAHYTQAGYNEMGRIGAETVADRTSAPHWQSQSSGLFFDTTGGGNVGIGTTTPRSPLDVNGFINTNGTTGGYKIDGNLVLQASSTTFSTSVGQAAGTALNASALYNTALGWNALAVATSSGLNTALGVNTLAADTSGGSNTAVGVAALYSNTTGGGNNALGQSALQSNTTGTFNNAFGYATLYLSTTASFNTAFGSGALGAVTTGGNNIALGASAGGNLTTGSQNIMIGFGAYATSSTATKSLNIGSLIFGTGLDGLNGTMSSGNIGIGTTTPWGRLSVKGVGTGTGLGFVFSDSNNNAKFVIQDNGNLGIGTTSPDMLLSVGSATPVGNVAHFENSTGSCYINPTTTSLSCSSDARLKKNVTPIDASSTLAALMQLTPVAYNWNNEPASTPPHTGFIAQQVLPILPDLVSKGPDGFYTLNYAGFTPYLVEAIQEIASISGAFRDNLAAWLGNAGNGIHQLFADIGNFHQVNTDTLCVGSTCVTEQQLKALLNQAGQGSAPATSAPVAPTADTATTTPDTASSTPAAPTTDATSTPSQSSDTTTSTPGTASSSTSDQPPPPAPASIGPSAGSPAPTDTPTSDTTAPAASASATL